MASFFQSLIGSFMEDPSRRDRLSNVHLRKTHENAAKLKASWASPVKYDGFWRSETMTNSYNHNLKNRRDVNVGIIMSREDKGALHGGVNSIDSALAAMDSMKSEA